MDELIQQLSEKFTSRGEKPETYLNGLLHSKPITYWDYVEVDTLLSLQKPRTDFKDEEIFIMYHQVTELVLKMMLHEIKQLTEADKLTEEVLSSKTDRLTRYTKLLISSFDIMKYGMSYEDYNIFRDSLTPASGFQSAQFRFLEIYCTPIPNLINEDKKAELPEKPEMSDYFQNIYWKSAGLRKGGKQKTVTLSEFEKRYEADFITLAERMKGKTLEECIKAMGELSEDTLAKLREFDWLYNVEWPLVHLSTAAHYLDSKGENKAATGGSEWKKYLHPKHQRRRFFPDLWSEEIRAAWAADR